MDFESAQTQVEHILISVRKKKRKKKRKKRKEKKNLLKLREARKMSAEPSLLCAGDLEAD